MRPKVTFVGPRLKVRAKPLARARSALVLIVASVVFGAAGAAAVAAGAYFAVEALLHALRSGSG
jgi:hypothetical protein